MKGYRTLAYNVARAIVDSGLFVMLMAVDWETAGLSPQAAVVLLLAVSFVDKVINIGLRLATTTPVGKSQ